ncbi:methylated-DNA--[protein]-cysteine S-methyltransferase [Haloechinothrix halophila]|uniref:methylated-DNA--[protein]-cysteine S-methyltransferase n=1 Tax=Haloechinothrix halophila TaxID=1069073 RepID=UPI0004079945|nr:methylated-DNA--[protein]-cysteine S-methyltransferase [Haloechinothrix halophila]
MTRSPGSPTLATADLATPVGRVAVAVSDAGVRAIGWCSAGELADRAVSDERADTVLAQLAEYFRGERREFDVPLDWSGTTETQRRVLRALYEQVPYGTSVTYGELAVLSGTGVPARAIGSIMGSNPIPIVVPCHRVLAHDGLGGYSGGGAGHGFEVKRWLLTLEGALPPTLDWSPAGLP